MYLTNTLEFNGKDKSSKILHLIQSFAEVSTFFQKILSIKINFNIIICIHAMLVITIMLEKAQYLFLKYSICIMS